MKGRAVVLLGLTAALIAALPVAVAEAAGTQNLDAFRTQIASDLLALETRLHSKHNEIVESVESKILQEINKLKKSVESLSKGSGESESVRKQLSKIQTELAATKEKLDKTNEKIRLLQAENITLRQQLDSLKELDSSVQWKAWRDFLGEKFRFFTSNTAKFADVARSSAVQFTDFAQTKGVWFVEQWNYLYDKYFQYAIPFAIKTSDKVIAWAQETHQKWRPTLDQQIFRVHEFVQHHPKLSGYQLEKYITVETIAAITVVFASVILRLLLSFCCRRTKRTPKAVQSPLKH